MNSLSLFHKLKKKFADAFLDQMLFLLGYFYYSAIGVILSWIEDFAYLVLV